MEISQYQICRFHDMVRHFAAKHELSVEVYTDFVRKDRSDIWFTRGQKRMCRNVIWERGTSISHAASVVFEDARVYFGLDGLNPACNNFEIKDVIFNAPATIVLWADGTKTVVKCQEDDVYSKEVGLALCFAKKALGNAGNYNNVFKKWIPEEEVPVCMELPDLPIFGLSDFKKIAEDIFRTSRGEN